MATKKQHFVPQVYLKAWETKVENTKEPMKKFNGLYYFKKGTTIGEGCKCESILWKPHLYTINFSQFYLAKKCPRVHSFFVDKIYSSMKNNRPQPVYAKLNYDIIETKNSIRKHLFDIADWEFFYYNGTTAKKNALLNRFNDMNCYILEDSFASIFESKWKATYMRFINETKRAIPNPLTGDKTISKKSFIDIIEFFFMMICRSPNFDPMGIYSFEKDMLRQAFLDSDEIYKIANAIWFTELYRIFYKEKGGFYNKIVKQSLKNCSIILFEAYPNAGTFITSDNPAFMHMSYVEATNMNGYYFPISPKHLLFICNGDGLANLVGYRMANSDLVKKFNRLILSYSIELIISKEKELNKIL